MCKACQNSLNGMKKRKKATHHRRRRSSRVRGLNTSDAGHFATNTLLPGIAGAVLATYLPKLPFLKDHPQYSNYAGLAGGVLLAVATESPMLQAAGAGMAIAAGAAVANDILDGQSPTTGLGLLYPGQSARGIAGAGDIGDNPVNMVI